MSADEIIAEVIRDKTFYENSGGGITVSGGEPLMMPEFTKEILMKAKEQGIHTAIETSGFAPWQDIEGMLPFIDLFLFDIKESDDELHKKYTGVSLSLIRENLSRLNAAGARIILRVPIIPGYNDRDEHLRGVGKLAEKYESVERVDVMPYHPLGKSKSEDIGKEYTVDISEFPSDDDVNRWISMISEETKKQVQKG
jgi:pyruvate formate lyase activating enzyme